MMFKAFGRKSVKRVQIWSSFGKTTSEDSRDASLTSGTGTSTSSGNATSSSQFSKASKYSSSSGGSSLTGVKEMVSDGVMVFKYKELSRATSNFNPSKKIGSSSFRATVRNRDVFIVLQKRGFVGNFLRKLKMLCSVHHASVVKLFGACFSEGEHLYLVYEYAEGINLRECLRNSRTPGFTVLDSWVKRLQVAMELAQGLEYLHDYTFGDFIHKYIKSSNIIIDSELHAKIAKFGIPQLTGEIDWRASDEPIHEESEADGQQGQERNLTRSHSIRLTGTPGYMSPEYLSSSLITKKLDVFSFGVILLELLTGKDPATVKYNLTGGLYSNMSLPEMARALAADNQWTRNLRLWIDSLLKDSYPLKSAYEVVLLAKACVEPDPNDRPEMKDVAVKLARLLVIFQNWESSMAVARNLQSKEMEAR
ncbi:hypothetical protein O6H91_04G040800 [Diphasiastrum complanatum]|uniref:Uncharacterized protein n=1 Tax=Diphasiastrum complanatum TaxID=34168 RepID=A0ACC2DWS6_DIPCM|nr:hypothetical protein O6H91_04G040800 [Diphasiastrum complanatum]